MPSSVATSQITRERARPRVRAYERGVIQQEFDAHRHTQTRMADVFRGADINRKVARPYPVSQTPAKCRIAVDKFAQLDGLWADLGRVHRLRMVRSHCHIISWGRSCSAAQMIVSASAIARSVSFA